jgi:hypothetical protein
VGGSKETDSASVVSMQIWGIKENKDNLNLSADQWSVLMREINILNPNLKSRKSIFNSTLYNANDQSIFWDKCKDFKSTVVLLKTNHSKIIGLYSPDTWV